RQMCIRDRLIGIKSLSPQSEIARPIISAEYILKQNPDLLILGINADGNILNANALLKNTKAAQMGQIYHNENTHISVSYTHLRAHETPEHLVCRLLLEKKKK
ncbi:hypothetical protein K777_09505, partial [Campylobacter coli CVM 41970]